VKPLPFAVKARWQDALPAYRRLGPYRPLGRQLMMTCLWQAQLLERFLLEHLHMGHSPLVEEAREVGQSARRVQGSRAPHSVSRPLLSSPYPFLGRFDTTSGARLGVLRALELEGPLPSTPDTGEPPVKHCTTVMPLSCFILHLWGSFLREIFLEAPLEKVSGLAPSLRCSRNQLLQGSTKEDHVFIPLNEAASSAVRLYRRSTRLCSVKNGWRHGSPSKVSPLVLSLPLMGPSYAVVA
jgi:hypothetical protein